MKRSTKSSIFIDTYQGGLKESGDIVIPLQEWNHSKKSDIKADLFELCATAKKWKKLLTEEITVFQICRTCLRRS